MNEAILIAGAGEELIAALSSEAGKRGINSAVAVIPGSNGDNHRKPDEMTGNIVSVDWNPGSPVSARSLVLAAENRIGHIGGAIVVCSAPDEAATRDFSPVGIETVVNNHIKSYMLLSRELVNYFQQKKTGTLALALFETPPNGLLSTSVFSAFRNFSDSLLEYSNTEYLKIAAFLCDEKNPPPVSEFAAYILKTLAETKKIDRSRFKFTKFKHSFGVRS